MNACVYPGSFDPLTIGHLDIIQRAAGLFEIVHVAILHNPDKAGLLTIQEKMEMIRLATAQIPQVRVDHFHGLLADYVQHKGACHVIRGLRSTEDFAYEMQMAQLNRHLNPKLETLFLMADPGHGHISASSVRQIASFGGKLGGLVPEVIEGPLGRILGKKFGEK